MTNCWHVYTVQVGQMKSLKAAQTTTLETAKKNNPYYLNMARI